MRDGGVWVREAVGSRGGLSEAKTDSQGEGTGLGGGVRGSGRANSKRTLHLTRMLADKASSGILPFEFSEVFNKYRKVHKPNVSTYSCTQHSVKK